MALATALTAGVSATLLTLLAKPDDFGLANTLTLVTVIAAGAFGADLSGSLSSTDFVEFTGQGSIGLYPFTVTLLSLTVAVIAFRRVTRSYRTEPAALGDALRTALLFGFCLWLPALLFTSDNEEMGRGWARDIDADSLGFQAEFGANPAGALFLGILIMGLVLVLSVLAHSASAPTTPEGSRLHAVMHQAREWVAAPLWGLTAVFLLLPAAGVIGIVAVSLFGEDNDIDLTGDETRLIVASCIALLANGGAWVLSLGSGAPFGTTSSDSESGDEQSWERLWGQITEDEPGLWVSPLVLLAVLAVAALVVIRRSRRGNELRDLGLWVGALVIAVPLLVRLTSFHLHGSVEQGDEEYWGTLFGGPEGFQTAVLTVIIASLVAFVVAMAVGVVKPSSVRDRIASAASGLQHTPETREVSADQHSAGSP